MTTKSSRKTNKSSRKSRGQLASTRGLRGGGISGLFAGRTIIPLLKLFILSPGRDFYQRELADLTGERLLLVQRAVARLVQAGLVNQAARGNRVYYRVDQSHPAFQDLKAVILKTVGIGDALRMQLARFGEKIKIAFVYGSVARGEETVSSDVDIMLIGDLSGREVASAFSSVKKMLNREINPSIYTPAEFRQKVRERHPFVTTLVREPKLFLLGDERALKAVLNRRSA